MMTSRTRTTKDFSAPLIDGGSLSMPPRQRWYHSILGKVTVFLIVGIIFSYGVGAAAGWFIVDKNSQTQWKRQANTNAHIISYIIRNIYTSVVARMDETGQITGIVTENFLGDDESILQTGFNPVDVLSLAAMQTNNRVWLFQYRENEGFVSIADANGTLNKHILMHDDGTPVQADARKNSFAGFVQINNEDYFVSEIPLLTPSGKMLGALVSSIGERQELYRTHNILLRNSLIGLGIVLLLTGLTVALLMRQFFYSVPVLIQALRRIAQGNTQDTTPFLQRDDEIGQLAVAIEKLRQAMVEREHLQLVKETVQKMEYMAHHDPLTGLPNRTFFGVALDNALTMLKLESKFFNLMLLDLDHFKEVNDTFGHVVGDALLIDVSERISLLLSTGNMVARLGGDEFAVIQLVKENPIQEAAQLAGQLIKSISEPFYIHGHEFGIGISIGIANAPQHGVTPHILMKNADLALYASKRTGRNNYHYFESGMAMTNSVPIIAELDIESAMDRNEFEIHYQPLIRLSDNSITGYEALVRWRRSPQELLMPDTFIPLAEKNGLIVRLGEWIIRQACSDAMTHFDARHRVSVNVSGIQIHHDGLIDVLKNALAQSRLPAYRIEIEITEPILLDRKEALPVLRKIQNMGIGIALDDFGTGYASLNCLADFPFTRVKLDKGLIDGLEDSESKRIIVANIMSLVHQLGMETLAEGVETELQRELLRRAGCQFVQGYLTGKAIPVTALEV
ncbi:bifunctional diguanylate cyclase/phosphodiesterase [Edaphovirga cremea]|uniref:bifunctional diguanylate cyclase/phosphodiesterase n=1 Tax=Edaphovirga cremea TaxID=2267246 RepID=UPI000DEF1C8E|nr:GGDEF domain-containing phosphodiesterase [Edaphovirga cremea]